MDIINILGQYAEPIGVASGIITVFLVARQNIWNWPIGIVSSGFFLLLFLQYGLYADVGLQAFYVVLGLYGWYYWARGDRNKRVDDELPSTWMKRQNLIILLAIGVFGVLLGGYLLDNYTNSTVPYPDAFTTTFSLVAQYMLTRKYIQSWLVWIILVNVPYIFIYIYKGLVLTAGLQFVFIALSLMGLFAWMKSNQQLENKKQAIHEPRN